MKKQIENASEVKYSSLTSTVAHETRKNPKRLMSRNVKFFCSTVISLVLILSTMVFTNGCGGKKDNADCPGDGHSKGKRSMEGCNWACVWYNGEYLTQNGICCCYQ